VPSRILWYWENRVVYNWLGGDISVETIARGSTIILQKIETADAPVHLIFNADTVGKVPRSVGQLAQATRLVFSHPKVGGIIIVTNNLLVRFLGQIVPRLFQKNSYSVTTLDDGVKMLMRLDTSLPTLSSDPTQRTDGIYID
jgi:hypothetical protein